MKDHMTHQLARELRQAGAGDTEAEELITIAGNLPQLKSYKHFKNEQVKVKRPSLWSFRLLAGGVVGLSAAALLILLSQPVLPTSWLYPVQKFSDDVAVTMRPAYRANVMMRRAQQVNALVAAHAPSDKVLATLNDYTAEADAYESTPHASYAAFQYCKANLQQAAAIAPTHVRQAITTSLESLDTT